MIQGLATVNLFIIFLIILAGFAVIRLVKKKFEDSMNWTRIFQNEPRGEQKSEVSADRITVWTLILMNGFFLSYFFLQ